MAFHHVGTQERVQIPAPALRGGTEVGWRCPVPISLSPSSACRSAQDPRFPQFRNSRLPRHSSSVWCPAWEVGYLGQGHCPGTGWQEVLLLLLLRAGTHQEETPDHYPGWAVKGAATCWGDMEWGSLDLQGWVRDTLVFLLLGSSTFWKHRCRPHAEVPPKTPFNYE